MRKIDYISWFLSVLINIFIIFLIGYKPSEYTDNIVKIGLVSIENNSVTSNLKGNKNIDSSIKNLEEKTVSQINEKKDKEIKEKSDNIIDMKPEIIKSESENENTQKKSLDDLKKAISNSKPKLKNNFEENSKGFNPEQESDEDLDRILGTVNGEEGLISGNKNGTLDGKIIVKWNPNNKKPIFPEEAQKNGKNGKVILLLKVDKFGNIMSYKIEKGSGVPDIDIAIERIINSWKIKLIKNNKEIGGSFYIHYNFNLK